MAIKPARESVLIAGASEGMGATIATRLGHAGYKVFGTASVAPAAEPQRFRMLAMDPRDPASIAAAIDSVITQAGRIDTFVNAIGSGSSGAIEDVDPSDLVDLFEANVLGPLRVCQAIIPVMRRQKSGRIIHLSSLAARVGVPHQGAYSATRAALSRLSESMRIELAPFGIQVTTIEPDDSQREDGDLLHGADKVAYLVARILRAKNPKIRYDAPLGRNNVLLRWMRELLPDHASTPRNGRVYEVKSSGD